MSKAFRKRNLCERKNDRAIRPSDLQTDEAATAIRSVLINSFRIASIQR